MEKKDGVYEVSDSYARNFLFPRNLAVPADATAINEVKTKAAAQHHAEEELAAAKALAAKLSGQTVVLKARAGQGGRLFGSVTSKGYCRCVEPGSWGRTWIKRKIVLESEIKNFGSYPLEVKVYPKVTAKLTVRVEE